jgi:hypothetical protein
MTRELDTDSLITFELYGIYLLYFGGQRAGEAGRPASVSEAWRQGGIASLNHLVRLSACFRALGPCTRAHYTSPIYDNLLPILEMILWIRVVR